MGPCWEFFFPFYFISSVFFKTVSLNYCLVKNQKTKAAHINRVAWKWNKTAMVESRDGGAPAGTSLGTHRLGGTFHLQGLEQLSGVYRLWFGISTSLDFPISYGTEPQAHTGSWPGPLWSRKGRATLLMWPATLTGEYRFCRGSQGSNPGAKLAFRWTWVQLCMLSRHHTEPISRSTFLEDIIQWCKLL